MNSTERSGLTMTGNVGGSSTGMSTPAALRGLELHALALHALEQFHAGNGASNDDVVRRAVQAR